MADNVGYTPGSGATVAADDIGGVLYQRVKPVTGDDGTATDVSATNPMPVAAYGELIEAIESLRMAVNSIARMLPQRGAQESINTNIISGSLSTVNSVSSVSSIGSISSLASITTIANRNFIEVPELLANISAQSIRNNITVS